MLVLWRAPGCRPDIREPDTSTGSVGMSFSMVMEWVQNTYNMSCPDGTWLEHGMPDCSSGQRKPCLEAHFLQIRPKDKVVGGGRASESQTAPNSISKTGIPSGHACRGQKLQAGLTDGKVGVEAQLRGAQCAGSLGERLVVSQEQGIPLWPSKAMQKAPRSGLGI